VAALRVVGLGLDVVLLDRVAAVLARHGDRFLRRLLGPDELRELDRRSPLETGRLEYVAGRFAAKEAVAKAIGTGVGALGWAGVQILDDGRGRPVCDLAGRARAAAGAAGVSAVLVSISHTGPLALACAVAVGEDES
jgi:holo-[acyl-carrier protein] synthase